LEDSHDLKLFISEFDLYSCVLFTLSPDLLVPYIVCLSVYISDFHDVNAFLPIIYPYAVEHSESPSLSRRRTELRLIKPTLRSADSRFGELNESWIYIHTKLNDAHGM
jgi:hypothetical protein